MWIAVLVLSILPPQALAQSSKSVAVTIYRPSGSMLGSTMFSCDHNKYKIVVFRDGQKMLRIQKGSFVKLRLPVGHYAFKSTRSNTLEIDLKAGEQYFIRPRQTCGGAFHAQEAIELVACEEATTEAQPLSPLDANDIYIDKGLVENVSHYSGICRERPAF
jgi:hypothetical protein